MVDMIRLQHDYVSIPARTLVPFLKGLKSQDPLVERARSKLLNWDFELTSDSVEAGIYVAFERNVLRKIEELKVPSIAREYLTIGLKKATDMLMAPDGDFGDDRILKQIARACKNNEVISNYERNYVQKLAEQHLGKKPLTNKKPETITPEIPKIEIPKPEPLITTQLSQSTNNSKSKNSKLFLGFGGVAVVIIIAAAFLLSNNIDSSQSNIVSEIKIEF